MLFNKMNIKNKKVILIGNGPSVIKNPKGLFIDKFDIVIRFNSYVINGYEKFVGTKTDIWATTHNHNILSTNVPDLIISAHKNSKKISNYSDKNIISIPTRFYNKCRSKLKNLGADEKIIPSTGYLTTAWLLDNYIDFLYITGFDHFSKKESSLHHYWINASYKEPIEHSHIYEKQIFDEWRKSSKVLDF